MNILAINGSHRGVGGFTQVLINKIKKGAEDAGGKFETVILAETSINPCKGCFLCQKKESYLKCIYENKDEVTSVFKKMKEADLIIYATPVYMYTISSMLKMFFERFMSTGNCQDLCLTKSKLFFHHVTREIYCKPFVLLACYDNMEYESCSNVVAYFKTFAKFMDCKMVGTLIRKSSEAMGHGKCSEKEKQYPIIKEVYAAYEAAGRELVESGHIKKSTQKKANKNIMPIPGLDLMMKIKLIKPMLIKKAKEHML